MPSKSTVKVVVNPGAASGILRSADTQDAMDELARAALAMQTALCPVDTSRLVKSLTIRKVGIGRDIGSFDVDYAAAVENGHRTKSGTYVPAQPFVRPSLDAVRRRLQNG
jgi:hypothetical protein